MRIAIVGSRDYKNLQAVANYVDGLPSDTIVISGGARGVDRAAIRAAKECGLQTEVYPAEWDKYGKEAGFRRNYTIASKASKVVAFWDGESAGTAHTIRIARKMGKPVEIIQDIE